MTVKVVVPKTFPLVESEAVSIRDWEGVNLYDAALWVRGVAELHCLVLG